MTRARPELAASDDPRGSYRIPLVLLGLTLALTAAAWSLAVREHEPSWLLRIEPLEDTSELRIKLRVWGTRHRDLVVRRVPGESAVTLELPEALGTLPGDWRIEVELSQSGGDGSSAPVAVDLNGRPVLVIPSDRDGGEVRLGREQIADGPNTLRVDLPRPERLVKLAAQNTRAGAGLRVREFRVALFDGGRDALDRLGPTEWRLLPVGLALVAASLVGVFRLLSRPNQLPLFTAGQWVGLLSACAIALALICTVNLVSPVVLCVTAWSFVLAAVLYWLSFALACFFRNLRVMRFGALSPLERESWIDRRRALCIFAILLAIFLSTGRRMPGQDTVPPPLIAQSLIREGNFDLDEFDPIYHWEGDPWVLDTRDIGATRPHVVSRWAPGNAILALPFFAVPTLMGLQPNGHGQDALSKLSAAFTAALSAALVFLACLRVASAKGALLVTIGYALGTSTFVYSSQDLWQHTAAQLCLAVALFAVVTADEHPRRHWLAGLALGFCVFCREIDLLFVLAMLAYVGLRFGPRRWITYALAGLPTAALLLGYNLYYFDQLVSASYVGIPNGTFGGDALEGFLGLWVSPNRGLLIYSPYILFALYGAWVAARHENPHVRWFAWCLVPALLGMILVHGALRVWHGTWGYGCRYATDGLVFWSFLLAVVIDRVWARRASRLAFSGLLALSIFFHAIGSYQDPYGWNREAWRRYGNLEDACWSWSYTQIGYQIRRMFGS